MNRVVSWFSRGNASAVATKLAIAEHGAENVTVACIALTTEHPDSVRFAAECEDWFGVPITYLSSERYADTWAVWEGERFIVGPHGAPCTGILKKAVRHAFQRPDDRQVFGYTADRKDVKRIPRLLDSEPGLILLTPLVERGLTKANCHAIVEGAGIKRSAMYELGYENNNCIGCPKGGIGYWNAIRVDFPDEFHRMAKLERDVGHAVLADEIPGPKRTEWIESEGAYVDFPTRLKRPLWLDELDPGRGNFKRDQPADCSLACAAVEVEIGAAS